MDLDTTKENIQPLPGGRNVSQLSVALQAQHNEEYRQDLERQKQEYEIAIRTYTGDDPLDNYYRYICWVEQSYPKHGHEGNFEPILEDCIRKFENDKRYYNDVRLCKILIKYLDMTDNPTEYYPIFHAKGLCKNCAEFYKAWSYYHEAVGEYERAQDVLEKGKSEFAQPYHELEQALQNLYCAVGQKCISGVINEARLMEQRRAMTTLHTYRSGTTVGSMRYPSSSNAGILPMNNAHTVPNNNQQRSNVPLQIYQGDQAEAAATLQPASFNYSGSILQAIKRDVPKENLMKAGKWTNYKTGNSVGQKSSSIIVHEDSREPHIIGIRLPPSFSSHVREDLTMWETDICLPDPDDPTKIPMYCKSQVYIDPTTEYSIEEVRSKRYLRKPRTSRLSVPVMETEQAIQSIVDSEDKMDLSMSETPTDAPQPMQQDISRQNSLEYHHQDRTLSNSHQFPPHIAPTTIIASPSHNTFYHQSISQIHDLYPPTPKEHHQNNTQYDMLAPNVSTYHHVPSPHHPPPATPLASITLQQPSMHILTTPLHPTPFGVRETNNFPQTPGMNELNELYNSSSEINDSMFNDLWSNSSHNSPSSLIHTQTLHKPAKTSFSVYEHQDAIAMHPKGSAMKTPLKMPSVEDLAETGSRGGLDIAAVAQPSDVAKRLIAVDEDSSHGYTDFNATNTETFGMNAMHVSTPLNKQNLHQMMTNDPQTTKKKLFLGLSDITEEKSFCSTSSGLMNHQKLSFSQLSNMNPIKEEKNYVYDYNLAENMKANEALRSSLGLSVVGDTRPETNYIHLYDDDNNEYESEQQEDFTPYAVLPNAPSDPFRSNVIEGLLRHVGFPGRRHRPTYAVLQSTPRLGVKKEPCYVGNERFIVEKLLGKGTYGSVFKALQLSTEQRVALKFQKTPNRWEYYICCELQARLAQHPLRDSFMRIHKGYFSDNCSIFLSDFFQYGSLLDLTNSMRTKLLRRKSENLCIYLAIEMLNLVQAMHEAKIIHADIKPDNFLISLKDDYIKLHLIDFGCSIDMSLYPEGTTFTRRVRTDSFVCCEMLEGRPWSYHTDLFCVAATIHVVLFETYIEVKKKDGVWGIVKKLRYINVDMWNTFFGRLLNMSEGFPDIEELKNIIVGFMDRNLLKSEMRDVVNLLKNR